MKGTRAFDFLDAVVTTLQAAEGFRAPDDQTTEGTPVFDGPVVTGEDPELYVVIGATELSDEDTDETGFSVESEWRTVPVQSGHRGEQVTVPCAVVRWAGSGSWSNMRGDVDDVMDSFATALISVAQVGLAGLTYLNVENLELRQVPDDDGLECRLTFDLTAAFLV
jgi:hypothetical protein